jgi:signal transduction histidine kinase
MQTLPFRTLRGKLIAAMVATTLTALLVAGIAVVAYDLRAYRFNTIADIETQTELLAGSTAAALNFDDAETANEGLGVLRFRPRVGAAAVYNARGKLFATYVREGTAPDFPELPGDEGVQIDGDQIYAFRRVVEQGEILGTVYVRRDYRLRERAFDYIGIVTVVAVLALAVAVLVSMWLQTVITKPVLSAAHAAREVVTHKDYSARARKFSDDEVGTLVDAFNEMLAVVEVRTRELERLNADMEREIAERRRIEEEMTQLNIDLERRVRERTAQLEMTNAELESFCYSVSHDLRAPVRAIDGFSQALAEELPEQLSDGARRYFERIRAATQRMGQLIEDLLNLSKVSRGTLELREVDLSALANQVIRDLATRDPERNVDVSVWEGIKVNGDVRLLRAALENLLGNSWKFTSKVAKPRIEVGTMRDGDRSVYFVRDNGAGFDMAYADKLFGAFQRLHGMEEFPGTGIGLATVQRIVHRHGGRVWADAAPGRGAVFYFTLAPESEPVGPVASN